jgi:hypothetical protein
MNPPVSRETSRQQLVGGIVCLLASIVLFYLLQLNPILGRNESGAPKSNQNDFKHIYLGALLLSEGQSPYDRELIYTLALAEGSSDPRFVSVDDQGQVVPRVLPYVYLPFTGIVFIPLTLVSFHQAANIFMFLNALFLFAGFACLTRAERLPFSAGTVALCALPVLLNFSVFRNATAGQLNAVLFFGASLLYLQLSQTRRPWLSGLIAALLMLFKITPGVFLLWFLLSRRWAEAGWMIALSLGITLACALVVGFGTHLQFLPVLADMGFGKSTWGDVGYTFWRDPFNQSINSFFHHILVPWPGMTPWIDSTPFMANALTWCCALLILLGFASTVWLKTCSKEFTDSERLGFSAAVLAGLLAPSIMWDHYLIQALLPAFVLWCVAGRKTCNRRKLLLRGVVILFWVISSLGFDPGSGILHTGIFGVANIVHGRFRLPFAEGPFGLIWMSLKLWPTLLLFISGLVLLWLVKNNPNSTDENLDAYKNSIDGT